MTPETKKYISNLDPQTREYWEERAAIIEECCHVSREVAEQAAWLETSAFMLKNRIKKMSDHRGG